MVGDVSILLHLILVLGLLWLSSSFFSTSHPLPYILSFVYLYLVNDRYTQRLRRRIQFEERNSANQSRLLSDSESVRWLNHAIAKVWPICMEQIASQQFLLPIIPWFLDKYKPWTAQKAVVQHLYLGKSPPVFNKIRVLAQSADDDHLVLELGMSFLAGDDMSAILAVQLRKSLGFGMWTKMHMRGMHVEGKVLVGVKFLQQWPFLGRLRMSFLEPPYFQMTVTPIFSHGVDVTELPGIAGWLDRLLSVAFQQTLVEPNMIVVDVEKFVSSPSENWFTVDEKPPIATAKVEIIEGVDMKPSDLNGLADPYVKGRLGSCTFQTKIQWKTLNPKWHERFIIPITSWDKPNILVLEVRDKDRIFDDTLGNAKVNISDLRGGQRHDKWLVLENIKMGKLHLAITVIEANDSMKAEELEQYCEQDQLSTTPSAKENAEKRESTSESSEEQQQPRRRSEYEPINIDGQEKTGVWVHHPGSDVLETWEPRKGSRPKLGDIQLEAEGMASDSNSSDENLNGKKAKRPSKFSKGLKKFGTILRRSPKGASSGGSIHCTPIPTTPTNVVDVREKNIKIFWDRNVDAIDEDGGNGMEGQGEQSKGTFRKGIQNIKKSLSDRRPNKSKGGGDSEGDDGFGAEGGEERVSTASPSSGAKEVQSGPISKSSN